MVPPTDMTLPRDARADGGRRPAIGNATAVRGQLAAREDVWVDGQFEGEIQAAGHRVTVGASGRVRGEVRAREVVVEGELHGETHAEKQAVVRAGGRMQGDLRAPLVVLEDGCWFSGTVDMSAPGSAAAAPAPTADTPDAASPGAAPATEPEPQPAVPAREPGD
jgi:cytoskeletal protein CcmA (bactofilin family)